MPVGGSDPVTLEPRPHDAPDIHHVGIAVRSIDEAMEFYGGKMGLQIVDRRHLDDRKLNVAFIKTGNTLIELLESTDPTNTVARFIERRGPGLHHLCFGTPDIDAHLRELKGMGVDLIDDEARAGAHGRVAFVHPSASHGTLVEFIEEGHVELMTESAKEKGHS